MGRTNENVPEFTTEKSGDKFWVNGKFNCLGRFTAQGYEVYRAFKEKIAIFGTTATLSAKVHPTTEKDWDNFRALMLEHHNINLESEEYPNGI